MKTVYRLVASSDQDFALLFRGRDDYSANLYFLEFYFETFDKKAIESALSGISTRATEKGPEYEEDFMRSVIRLRDWLTGYSGESLAYFHEKSFGGNAYVTLSSLRVPESGDFFGE